MRLKLPLQTFVSMVARWPKHFDLLARRRRGSSRIGGPSFDIQRTRCLGFAPLILFFSASIFRTANHLPFLRANVIGTIGSKITFTTKDGRFGEKKLSRYLDWCHVETAYQKLKTLFYVVYQLEAARKCFRKICHFLGSYIFEQNPILKFFECLRIETNVIEIDRILLHMSEFVFYMKKRSSMTLIIQNWMNSFHFIIIPELKLLASKKAVCCHCYYV